MRRYTLCKLCLAVLALLFLMRFAGLAAEDVSFRQSGGELLLSGTVCDIQKKETVYHQSRLLISLKNIILYEKPQKRRSAERLSGVELPGSVLCYLKPDQEIPLMGERVLLSGSVQEFSHSSNPGGFDEKNYREARGFSFCLKSAQIVRRGSSYSAYRHFLYRAKESLSHMIDAICVESDACVIKAMLLGDKDELDSTLKKLYQENGIAHILAISGLHISFLGVGAYELLKRLLPVWAAAPATGFVMISYMIMTGCSPSAVRAVAMFVIRLLADVTHRSYDRPTSLSLSGLILCLWHPALVNDSAFLLSYGAIVGLEWVYPILFFQDKAAEKIEMNFFRRSLIHIRRCLAPGLSINLVALPILLDSFYEFPVISLLLNMLVIPLMSLVMASSFSALLGGAACVTLGKVLFFPAHFVLLLFQKACEFTSSLPDTVWVTGKPDAWCICLYYVSLLLLLMYKNVRGNGMPPCQKYFHLAVMVWILTSPVHQFFSVTCLDVGQGDGIVLRTDGNSVILIDGGSSSEKKLAEYTLIPYLKSQGIMEISCIFLSHLDEDHVNGVRELIASGKQEHIRIGRLVMPPGLRDESYDTIVREAASAQIPVAAIGQGDSVLFDEVRITCLHPSENETFSDRNDGSVVLQLVRKDFSALFMGDLDGEAEKSFAERYHGRVTMLKVGHHGSGNSCQEHFLNRIRPEIAVISCGKNNSYGHPDSETIERLADAGALIFTTPECGAVTVKSNGKTDCFCGEKVLYY